MMMYGKLTEPSILKLERDSICWNTAATTEDSVVKTEEETAGYMVVGDTSNVVVVGDTKWFVPNATLRGGVEAFQD
jgi:hypothetical protein